MRIPKPRAEVIGSAVIASIILFFTFLAVRSLCVGIATAASAIWLSLVALHLFAACQAIGIRRWMIGVLGALASRHFVEQLQCNASAPAVRFGFSILGLRLYFLTIPVGDIRCVCWDTGQATSMAGRDMNDWQVAMWYEHHGSVRRDVQLLSRPGQEIYIVGPGCRKETTAAFGVEFVTFLNEAGARLVEFGNDCTYASDPPASSA